MYYRIVSVVRSLRIASDLLRKSVRWTALYAPPSDPPADRWSTVRILLKRAPVFRPPVETSTPSLPHIRLIAEGGLLSVSQQIRNLYFPLPCPFTGTITAASSILFISADAKLSNLGQHQDDSYTCHHAKICSRDSFRMEEMRKSGFISAKFISILPKKGGKK